MLPAWIAVMAISIDFVVIGLWFRYTDQSWGTPLIFSSTMIFLVRLAIAAVILVWACRRYRVSAAALGMRPSTILADFRWSFRICALGALIITPTIAIGFAAALGLGIRLPAPPDLFVQIFGGSWSVPHAIFMVGLGVTGNILIAVTEELIYRSLLLPPLTCRLGLYAAVAVTAIVFGLAHVVPFLRVGFPVLEIIGGILMAAGFAIRWSVIPAMVIHAMGNLFAGMLAFVYVQLFKAYPALFLNAPA